MASSVYGGQRQPGSQGQGFQQDSEAGAARPCWNGSGSYGLPVSWRQWLLSRKRASRLPLWQCASQGTACNMTGRLGARQACLLPHWCRPLSHWCRCFRPRTCGTVSVPALKTAQSIECLPCTAAMLMSAQGAAQYETEYWFACTLGSAAQPTHSRPSRVKQTDSEDCHDHSPCYSPAGAGRSCEALAGRCLAFTVLPVCS